MRRLRRRPQGRPDRAAGLLPLAGTAVAIGLLGWLGTRAGPPAGRSGDDPRPEPWIDPRRLGLAALPPWADARWGEELDLALAEVPAFAASDAAGLERLAGRLRELPFVATVESPRIRPPDRIELALRLRRPVASIATGSGYLQVAEDGTVLPGSWPHPPQLDGAFLPVLGPIDDVDPVFRWARPGDFLVEDAHVDALDVAVSMARELAPEERRRLGRVVIDARHAREASVEEPGVRLELEGARRVLFGRAPWAGAPGELPVRRKWRSVVAALDPEVEASGWDLLDVRWDRPELGLRADWTARGEGAPAPAAESAAGSRAPEPLRTAATSRPVRPPQLSAEPREAGRPRVR